MDRKDRVRKERPLAQVRRVADDDHMVAPTGVICTILRGNRTWEQRRPSCGSIEPTMTAGDDPNPVTGSHSDGTDPDAGSGSDAGEQTREDAAMEQVWMEEPGAQGAQGLTSAWSDPAWRLMIDALNRPGSVTGLHGSLDEARPSSLGHLDDGIEREGAA